MQMAQQLDRIPHDLIQFLHILLHQLLHQHYLENPDVWAREDAEHTQLPFDDDDDDFVPEPTDDELEYDEDEDDVV